MGRESYICRECGYSGLPVIFKSLKEANEFRQEKKLKQLREMKLWGQKVFHRTVPVVVLVNWFTALFFFTFFLLGMLGYFRYEWFQWYFLALSIIVVAAGFGIIVNWGKERLTF